MLRKRSLAFTLVDALVIILLALLLAAIIYPSFSNRGHSHRPVCLSNLKQTATSLIMYETDWDGYLPRAPKWMDDLKPYTKADIIRCVVVKEPTKSGLALNRFLVGINVDKLPDPGLAHMAYDSMLLERNASEYFPSLPIPSRHGSLNYVSFVDGHAKGFPAKEN